MTYRLNRIKMFSDYPDWLMNILFPKGQKSRGIKLFLAYKHELKQVMRKRDVIQSNSSFHAVISNERAD